MSMMQEITGDQKKYVLSIHISGSHFTAAVFDHISRLPLSGTYCRVPVSHKAGVSLITAVWESYIDRILSKLQQGFIACCIAVPAVFDPDKNSGLGENTRLYPLFNKFSLKDFFAEKLSLSRDLIYLVSPASALLANEQYLNASLTGRYYAAIVIGTGVCGASSLEYFADDLKWESGLFKGSAVNQLLSVQWIGRRYQQLSGISVLNLEQFMEGAKTSITARSVLKEYLNNLADFLIARLPLDQLDTLYISGDLILASGTLKHLFQKRNIAVDIRFIQHEQMSILSGGVLLGYLSYGFLMVGEQQLAVAGQNK